MAIYKYSSIVKTSDDSAFDTLANPGSATLHPGIYRCEGCGKEVTSNKGNPLPPQNHHQHTATQGTIRWRLAVFAQTEG